MQLLGLANFLAKYSCPKWNKLRVLRRICRMGYHGLGQFWIWWQRWSRHINPSDERRNIREIESTLSELNCEVQNTYPWPYRDLRFADWKEDGSPEGYNLISDPAGFVIRRSTSYCAWKIYEATGRWPKNRAQGWQRFDARDWERFLTMNDFRRVSADELKSSSLRCCIGILPEQGEFGQVVWLEKIFPTFHERMRQVSYQVSTYENFQYKNYRLTNEDAHDVVWMGK